MNNVDISTLDPDTIKDQMSGLSGSIGSSNGVLEIVEAATKTSTSQNYSMETDAQVIQFYTEMQTTMSNTNNGILQTDTDAVKNASSANVEQLDAVYNNDSQLATAATQTFSTAETRGNNNISTTGNYISGTYSSIQTILSSLATSVSMLLNT